MFEERQLQKATLLFQHQRYDEAEKEYGALATQDPGNGYFHSMLALCTLYQDKKKEAARHAEEGIRQSPADGFSFYVAAVVALGTARLEEAENFCYSAIALDPHKADYFELRSLVLMNKKEWAEALKAADEGLAVEADHIGCLNCRAKALIKLNNKEQAYKTIEEALYFDPENSDTHANLGWGLLEKGEHKKALEHFKQALSINAGNEHAKAGLIEAMKARYWFYRLFLRYAFWISNLKGKAQWAIIIGFYLGSNLMRRLGENIPALQVITIPIVVLYTLFAITTWIIAPLSNLFLRLNTYGRYALNAEEIACSNYIGISLLVALLSGITFLFVNAVPLLMLAFLAFTITIPISGTFAAGRGTKGRLLLNIYTFAMLTLGILSIADQLVTGEALNGLATTYFIGFILYQWIANAILSRI